MNEKTIESRLRDHVKKLGGLAVKFFAMSFIGFPDRIVLMPGGKIWFVELKSTGKKPKDHQQVVLNQLTKLGFQVRVISDRIELLNFFNEIEKN